MLISIWEGQPEICLIYNVISIFTQQVKEGGGGLGVFRAFHEWEEQGDRGRTE